MNVKRGDTHTQRSHLFAKRRRQLKIFSQTKRVRSVTWGFFRLFLKKGGDVLKYSITLTLIKGGSGPWFLHLFHYPLSRSTPSRKDREGTKVVHVDSRTEVERRRFVTLSERGEKREPPSPQGVPRLECSGEPSLLGHVQPRRPFHEYLYLPPRFEGGVSGSSQSHSVSG